MDFDQILACKINAMPVSTLLKIQQSSQINIKFTQSQLISKYASWHKGHNEPWIHKPAKVNRLPQKGSLSQFSFALSKLLYEFYKAKFTYSYYIHCEYLPLYQNEVNEPVTRFHKRIYTLHVKKKKRQNCFSKCQWMSTEKNTWLQQNVWGAV